MSFGNGARGFGFGGNADFVPPDSSQPSKGNFGGSNVGFGGGAISGGFPSGVGFGNFGAVKGGGFSGRDSASGNTDGAIVGFGNTSKPGGFSGGTADIPRSCFNCDNVGHTSRDCPQLKQKENNFGGGDNSSGFGKYSSSFGGSTFGVFKGNSEPQGFSGGKFNTFGGGAGGEEKPRGCFNCGQEGHRSADCTEARKPREGCFNCGAHDHIRSDCPNPPEARDDGSKPASTFIPQYETEETLYTGGIEQGAMFERFFDAEVKLTRGGSTGAIEKVIPIQSFQELHLTDKVYENVIKSGYKKPTPVQQYATPLIMQGCDMLGCAQTGSGKTAAFLLPVMSKLLEKSDLSNSAERPCMPRCLILAPTRELAVQIFNESRKFSSGTILSTKCLYGGTSVSNQINDLQNGASIIVGTTGRVKHFIDAGYVSLEKLRFLVLDEADRMLDMGFGPDINAITTGRTITAKKHRQTLMFSATFPPEVQSQANHILNDDYAMISIDTIGAANKCITQEIIMIDDRKAKRDKFMELLGIDKYRRQVENGINVFDKKTLVFVAKKTFADTIGNMLCEAGIPATTIHGDRLQQQRSQAINDFIKGKKAVLVATAVAERGLDIKGVDTVINFDLPEELDQYVHRIGRTGRVGHAGRAISLFCPEKDSRLAPDLIKCMEMAGQVVPEFLYQLVGGVNGGFGGGSGGFNSGPAEAEEAW